MNNGQRDKGIEAQIKLISKCLCTGFLLFTLINSYGCATSKTEDVTTDVSAENNGRKIIKTIDFIGNDTLNTSTLLKKLDFKVGNYLDAMQVESGSSVISEFYRLKGYPDAKVTLDLAELSLGNVVYIIEEGPRIAIKSVDFEGNDSISTGNLKSIIKTSTRSWFFWPVYYTKEKIAADEQRLRQAYYKRGFLNHKITAVGRDDIVFQIEEGPQYKVGKVTVSGNKYFDAETLLAGFELKEGQVYLPPKASAYAQKILDRYNQNGFINAQVEYRHLFRNQDSDIVDIEFGITEGTQFRIGRIDISGNEQTRDKVYRHILDEYDFTPGELYNARLVPVQGEGKLHRYLKQMTMAEEVLISPVSPTDSNDSIIENRKDVRINVKEGLTGLLSPGVTFGTDSGVIGRFVITQNNFDITDWPESSEEFLTMKSFTGAGQSLRLALEPGTEVGYYSLSFTEPYFLDKPVSFDVEGSLFERWYESYDEKRKRIYTGFEKRYKSGWRNNLGFSFQNVNVSNLDYDAPQEIIDVKGNNLLIGADVGVGLDKTNDRFVPSAGYKLKFDYEQTTGDFDFGTISGSTVFYKTLFEDFTDRKTVLATKFLAAATESDAPPFEKFYAGGGMGTYSLRGFEYRGMSTRGLQTNVPDPIRKDPIGSDWIFLANTELSIPLLGDNVSGLLFLDSGTIDTGPYRSSVGIGLQIMIPNILGPVPMRFSYAFPMKKDDLDEVQHFSFFMGRLF